MVRCCRFRPGSSGLTRCRFQPAFTSTLAGIKGYSNPVIRLEAAHAILGSEDQIRAERRDATVELRSRGWTWDEIASLIGTTKQRAWQIGNGL
jgi:hypothetical protein